MEHWLRSLGCAAVLAVALGGCTATVEGGAYGPDLVSIGPDVQVVADYDEPVFFSDGFYWRYQGDSWYRSPYVDRGWVYARPPAAILSIRQPYAYRHYHPTGWHGGHAAPARAFHAPPPARQPVAGWHGNPAPARPAPVGGWHGPAPARPAPMQGRPAPQRMRPAPAPAHPAPRGERR